MYYPETACARMIENRPPRIAMTLLVAAAAMEFLIPDAWPHPRSVPTAAMLVGLPGFLLMIRAWWLFRSHNTAICPTAETTSLIRHDVFGLTRNPMYLGMVLMLLGTSLFAGSWPFYAMTIIYALVLDTVFCRYEERKMRASFGPRYEAYAKRVRRWL